MMQPVHPTEDQFARYQGRTLGTSELLEVADHIGVCDACREVLYTRERGAAQVRALRAEVSGHLEYEEIAAAAEGTIPDAVKRHLADCALCQTGVEDLRQFRTELKPVARSPIVMPAPPVRKARWAAGAIAAALLVAMAGTAYRYASPSLPGPGPNPAASSRPPANPSEAPLSAEQSAVVRSAMANLRLERSPVLDRVLSRHGVQLGTATGAAPFSPLGPMGTAVVTARPTFRWTPAAGAARYVVAVYDENFEKVTASEALTVTEWQPERALPRGRVYNWQVTATIGGREVQTPMPPAPEARFQVVAAEAASEIETVRRDHPGNHVLLAALYAKAGDLDDAVQEVDALAATDAATAAALKDSIERMRRQ